MVIKEGSAARFSLFSSLPNFSSENILKICTGAGWKQHLFPYRTNWRLISRPVRGTCRRKHQHQVLPAFAWNCPRNPMLSSLQLGTRHFQTLLNRSPSFPPVTTVKSLFAAHIYGCCNIFDSHSVALSFSVLGGDGDALGWLSWLMQRPWRRIRRGNRKFCSLNLLLSYCCSNRDSAQ